MTIFGISLTQADIYLIGVCGALIMALIYPRLNDWQHRRGRYRDAVHTFKAAFSDCTSAITNDSFAIDTFARDFDRHKSAVDAIRPILPKRHQRKLQKAWDEYCGKDNDLGFDAKGYVEAINATFESTDHAIFKAFINRFNALHYCLDGLL